MNFQLKNTLNTWVSIMSGLAISYAWYFYLNSSFNLLAGSGAVIIYFITAPIILIVCTTVIYKILESINPSLKNVIEPETLKTNYIFWLLFFIIIAIALFIFLKIYLPNYASRF